MKLFNLAMLSAGVCGILAHDGATAQENQAYPNRVIRVISPLGSNGAVEIVGRMVTQKMSESMNRQFVIEPRLGGGGTCSGSSAARGLRGEMGGLSLIDAT